MKVAYLAYTSDLNGLPLPHSYSVNVLDPGRTISDARKAKKAGADAVIVQIQWASEIVPEYVTDPAPAQEEIVKKLAQEPAITAIVGQGPHVVQPIIEVNDKPVVFSEGNLISNQGAAVGLAPGSQDGYIALLDLRVDGSGSEITDVRYVPVWVDHADYQVLPIGDALKAGEGDPAELRASYERTVDVVGHDTAEPVPPKLR